MSAIVRENLRGFRLMLLIGILGACGGKADLTIDVLFGDPTTPQPADPPYGGDVVYPSGLRMGLVPDAALTATYPDPGQNPFGGSRTSHYQRVGANEIVGFTLWTESEPASTGTLPADSGLPPPQPTRRTDTSVRNRLTGSSASGASIRPGRERPRGPPMPARV